MRTSLLALCALLLPSSALAQSDPNAPQGILPDTVAPIAYRLNLTILPDQPRFSGHTEIDATLKKASAAIYLHARDLHMAKVTVTAAGKTFPATLSQVTPTGAARLDFGRTLQPGKMTLSFDYDGAFTGDPAGLYHIKVGKEWYAWTQFESIDARSAFPSFDQPSYKTPFTVNLTTRPGFTAVSNAQETGETKAGALVTHHFAPTRPLPTYLVAFVVGPFLTEATTVPPTPERATPLPLRVVATQAQAGRLDYARDESGRIVSLLEKYFDMPFPFPKLDQIGSPIMPGAMENAGADIYGDDILLLPKGAPTTQKQEFGMVVAHELSHQWFGDLVTPAWWDDIWLNESFANWMGYRIGNEWRPELNIGANAIAEALGAMNIDSLEAGRPIHQHIARDADINGAFDQITYGKGGQVVAMIAAYLGDDIFREGVRLHMRRHAYGNATTDDFFSALADAAKDPRVLAAMRSFVDQPGVPLVTLHHEGGDLIASQSRFAYLGDKVTPQQWDIPLCARHGETRSCTLLDKPSQAVTLPGTGAIVPNAGGTGYYRFDLDPADWDALIASAASLPTGEALAVNDSLWANFYAGRGTVARLIAAARAMAANPDSNVAVDDGERLAGLAGRGLISADARPAFGKLIAGIYGPVLDKLGFDPGAGAFASDTPDRQKLRLEVIALMAGPAHDAAVRARLVKAADAYLGGDTKALDEGLIGLALGVTVEERDVAFAKSLAERALASEDAGFRAAALGAVAGSGKPEIADWMLKDMHDPRLRSIEMVRALGGFLGDPATRDAAADYLLTNYDDFAKGAGIFVTARLPSFFGGLCSAEQADALEAKLGPKVGAVGGTLGLQRTLENIRNCARFKDARGAEVSAAVLDTAK